VEEIDAISVMNLAFDGAEVMVDESLAAMVVQGRIGATQTSPVKAKAAART
jgi:hypothetical protein